MSRIVPGLYRGGGEKGKREKNKKERIGVARYVLKLEGMTERSRYSFELRYIYVCIKKGGSPDS